MLQVVENISKQPGAGVFVSVMIFIFFFYSNYNLLDSLLKMHRSKSAVKKIKSEYTFFQRLCLRHFRENCLHAAKFCNGLIIFQNTAWVYLGVCLICFILYLFGLLSAMFIAWLEFGLFVFFGLPTTLIYLVLARPVIVGRFKEFSFEKYHNTGNHDSLL